MLRNLSRGVFAIAALGASMARPPALAAQGVWALTNVRIQTVTNGTIENGTILIRDGLIEAVGRTVQIPPDARVLDLAGRTVSPGIVDLASTLGAAGTAPTPAPGGRGGSAAAEPSTGRPVGLDPARAMAGELEISAADLESARNAGITTILVAASRGAFRGRSALVPTGADLEPTSIVRSPVAVHMGFEGTRGSYPGTLLGVIAYERQTLYDAERYALVSDRYRTNPRGMARPVFDPGLEALVPVVRGEVPLFFAANSEGEIRRAARMAREFGASLTVVGATEGWRALDALAGHPAVVSVNFPKSNEVTGWAYRLVTRDGADSAAADAAGRRLVEGNAAALVRAGVTLALGSGGTSPADFIANVRKAVAAGLPADLALAALTIEPARMAGVGEVLGSIEAGKIANLAVTERGDLLADSGRVRDVFIDGVHYAVDPPAPRRTGAAAVAPAEVGGTWAMVLTSPQGPMDITMTITQSGSSFTGSMTSMMGTTPIDDGQISGRTLSWAMTITVNGQSIDIGYQGQVEGNRMTGSASLGSFGNATFTAEKTP